MSSALTGGCRCGAVRYTLQAETLPRTYACHCHGCQSWSGSAFSQQAMVGEGQIEVTGPVVIYELTSPSGSTSRQRMCGTCHARIYNTNSSRPGIAALRAGTLDRSDELDVVAHIWTKRKQAWIVVADGVPCWPENAPPAELMAALFPTG